jgi:hypothetical protein
VIPASEPYKCTFCSKRCAGGYCTTCGEWFDTSQDAIADYYAQFEDLETNR